MLSSCFFNITLNCDLQYLRQRLRGINSSCTILNNHTVALNPALSHSEAATVFPVLVLGCGVYWPAITNPLAVIDLLLSMAPVETWHICISSSSGSSWQDTFRSRHSWSVVRMYYKTHLWPGCGRESSSGLRIIMANPSIWHSKIIASGQQSLLS